MPSASDQHYKVLDIRDSPWTDGPGRTILECASDINQNRYKIIIATFQNSGAQLSDYALDAKKRGLQLEIITEKRALDMQVLSQILSCIRSNQIDIIHTHEFRSNLFGFLAAKLTRKPIVTTAHGWIQNSPMKKRIVKLDKFLLRFFDKIIAVSEAIKKLLLDAGVPEHKITVIPNALRTEKYANNKQNQGFRKEVGVDEEKILVANIGRLSPEKGQLEFLLAAVDFIPKFPNIHIIFVGIGPEEEKLKKFVADNNLSANVMFAGYRTDMVNIYNDIDLVVQSSYTEGMPNVVLEALLCQTPVIATDVGGTNEIIEHGYNGILIPDNKPSTLTQAIADFMENTTRHNEMARTGRKTIIDKFDHNTRVRKLESTYDELIKR